MGNAHAKQPSTITLSGHTSAVYACCVSPDGSRILSAGGDGSVKVWDFSSLEPVRELRGHNCPVYCCSISPDNATALSGDMDGIIKVWNLADGSVVGNLDDGHTRCVMSACFSRDGCRALTASSDKTLVHWDVTADGNGGVSGIKMRVLTGHKLSVNCAVFSPDGSMAISASSDNTLKIWNLATGKETRTLVGHTDAVLSCDVSPDGELVVSASQDATLKVWKLDLGKEIRTLSGHSDAVRSCSFAKDGAMILSGSYDTKCIAWVRVGGPESWTRASTMMSHTRGITSCALTPDSMVAVTASWDKNITLSSLGDARLFAEFADEESSLLRAHVDDVDLQQSHPAIHAAIAEIDSMVGCRKLKAKFNYLCTFFLRYGKFLALPNVHCNVLVYGQQGTGKTHFVRLLARFLNAAKIAPHGLPTAATNLQTATSDSVSLQATQAASEAMEKPLQADDGPVVQLRASKLKGSTVEQTGANCRAFLEKYRGQVVLVREVDLLPVSSEGDHGAAVARTIQQFLNDCPRSLTLVLLGFSRTDVGKFFMNYEPATPESVREHFPFRFETERYSPDELLAILRKQCAAEQLRFGGSVTDVMLDKTFLLNARFFEGSNGTGTKQIIKLARLEQNKRQDKREGVLESTDMQSAFQKLRQDWFEIHPDQTFTVLQQMQAEEKEKVRIARKSVGSDDGASDDAKEAVERLDISEPEDDADSSENGFTLEDYRMFHDKEMKRREDEHREKMQRERDECKLVVEQTKRAHTKTVNRMRAAGLSMAVVKWRLRRWVLALERWKAAAAWSWERRRMLNMVHSKARIVLSRTLFLKWARGTEHRRACSRRYNILRAAHVSRSLCASFAHWSMVRQEIIRIRLHKVVGHLQLLGSRDTFGVMQEVFEAWSALTEEELQLAKREWEASQKEKEHADAISALVKRNQNDVTELHLEYQERIRSQKSLRRTAENNLQPVKKWQSNAILAATLLVVIYFAPTVPALAPYVVETFRKLSFGHWYVAILVIASLFSALRRLISWLWTSVFPEKLKVSFRWLWETGFDSALVSVGVATGSWQFACAPPTAQRAIGPFTCSASGQCHSSDCLKEEALEGYISCSVRVERVAKIIVAVAGFVVAQKGKELAMQVHKRGFAGFVRAKVTRMVPSWFYSLHDQNSAEIIAMVKDDTVPLGKKAQACKRLAELANSSEGMVSVIVEGGGLQVLIDLIGRVSSQEGDLAMSGAKALRSLLISDQNIHQAVQKGAVSALVHLLMRTNTSGIIEETLVTLGALGRSSDSAADAIVADESFPSRLCSLLVSRETSTRRQTTVLVEKLTRDIETSSGQTSKILERRKILSSCIEPLVLELKRGATFQMFFCAQPENKALAARALGNLAAGCWGNMEEMMRTGVIQALMCILKMKGIWTGSLSKILLLKGDAAFAVASLAKGGDLPRGRLQEAGAISVLEQLWTAQVMIQSFSFFILCLHPACEDFLFNISMAQVHNVDGKEAVYMREEARMALKTVKGNFPGAATGAKASPKSSSSSSASASSTPQNQESTASSPPTSRS